MTSPLVATQHRNGFGITALVVSLIGLVFGIVPFAGFVAVICGIVALVFGLIGASRARKGIADNKRMSIIGSVLAVGALAAGGYGMAVVFTAVGELDREIERIDGEFQRDMGNLDRQLDQGSQSVQRLAPRAPMTLEAETTSTWPGIEFRYGECDPSLREFQLQLNNIGFSFEGTGCFADKTRIAVDAIQYQHVLPPTGMVDKATWDAAFSGEQIMPEVIELVGGASTF